MSVGCRVTLAPGQPARSARRVPPLSPPDRRRGGAAAADAAATETERTEALLRGAAAFEADADVPAGLACRALARQIARQEAHERNAAPAASSPPRTLAGTAWLNGLSLGTLAGALTVAAAALLLHPSSGSGGGSDSPEAAAGAAAPAATAAAAGVPADSGELRRVRPHPRPATDAALSSLPPGTFLPWQPPRRSSAVAPAVAAAAGAPEIRRAALTDAAAAAVATASSPPAPRAARHAISSRAKAEEEEEEAAPRRSVARGSLAAAPETRREMAPRQEPRPLVATLHTETVDRSAYQLVASGYVATPVEDGSGSGTATEAVVTPVSLQAELMPASGSGAATGATAPR